MLTPLTSVRKDHHHATGLDQANDFATDFDRGDQTKLIETLQRVTEPTSNRNISVINNSESRNREKSCRRLRRARVGSVVLSQSRLVCRLLDRRWRSGSGISPRRTHPQRRSASARNRVN